MKISQKKDKDINFGQKIYITSANNLIKPHQKEILAISGKIVTSWHIQNGKFIDEGLTEEMTVCTGFYLKNSKSGFFAHLIPHENPQNEIEKHAINAIRNLKEGKDVLSAVITGGYAIDKEGSFSVFKIIKEIFDNEKISYTNVWGLNGKYTDNMWTNLYVSIKDNLSNINISKFNNTEPIHVQNIAELKNTYQDVYISKNDTLEFI